MPDKIAPDGPFGEYPGYRSGTMCEGVAVRVKAITYRNDAIVKGQILDRKEVIKSSKVIY